MTTIHHSLAEYLLPILQIGNEIYGVCQLKTDEWAVTGCFFAKSFIMTLHWICAEIITINTVMKPVQNTTWIRGCFDSCRSIFLSNAFNRLSLRRFGLRAAVSTNGSCLLRDNKNRFSSERISVAAALISKLSIRLSPESIGSSIISSRWHTAERITPDPTNLDWHVSLMYESKITYLYKKNKNILESIERNLFWAGATLFSRCQQTLESVLKVGESSYLLPFSG